MEKQVEQTEKQPKRYITGFDGIRTIAVIGVILYHLLPTSMKGGYLGVPIFFVVSGYLITDLLVQEWEDNQKIDLWRFYSRRMKRLYPALVAMLLFATSYITLFQQNLLRDIRQIIISSLLYVNNWWQISNGLSYFDRFGNESPFTHLWSLAVEGQNYLVWPLVFILLIRFVKNKTKMFYGVIGLSLISAILMAVLYVPDADPTRVYYGTDTRLFSILVGGALAFIWPSRRLKKKIGKKARQILNGLGILSLILVILGLFVLDDHFSGVYYGGMFIYSLICGLLVAVTAHPGASVNKWLTNPVFTWIGKRSYGIYLYQFPVMIFYEAKVANFNELLWLHTLIELVLILGVSELSYRYVEKPFRKLEYQKLYLAAKTAFKEPRLLKQQLIYLPIVGVLLISLTGFIVAPANTVTAEQEQLQKQILANKELAEKTKQQEPPVPEATGPVESAPRITEEGVVLTEEQRRMGQGMEISAFGDSIMLDVAADFQQLFPKIIVDGEVGRQLYNSTPLITDMKNNGLLKDAVIVSLGTNGPFSEVQFDEVMAAFEGRKVYWINLRLPTRRWETDVNQMLSKMAEKYENMTLIDWYSYSQGHDDWFYEDRVHPNPTGASAYTNFVAQSILAAP